MPALGLSPSIYALSGGDFPLGFFTVSHRYLLTLGVPHERCPSVPILPTPFIVSQTPSPNYWECHTAFLYVKKVSVKKLRVDNAEIVERKSS